jgi:formylglycine-generating enzyme required for sulfatase activity/serine/threonine protein kinase
MEFLEGETLRQALQRRGALPVPEVAEILQQAARGLNAAHKLGIIHRDLKPDNIFLTRGDEGETIVKVVDFGIAKLRESATHTQTGTVLGTPAYMSFEQASGMRSDELDARSDLYSLGVVVYEMLTGRLPFHSDTPVGYLRKHMVEDPPPFRAVAPGLDVPPAVESAVMKALVKDRDQRFASVLDFARDFARAATLPSAVESPKPLVTTKRVEPAIPPREPGSPRGEPSAPPVAPVASLPNVGASGARPEAEGSPRRSLPPSEPRPLAKKRSTVGIASLVVAVVVVMVVALVWVYWPVPTKPPSPQPGAPQQEASVPAKPETSVPAPSVNNPPTNPPSPQANPAQIVVQTSTNAQVYLDDTFKGQVGRKGRLVIEDLKPGEHALRVSLAGKKDYEQRVTVAAGQVATITATLADAEQPSPPAPVETPRRTVSAPVGRTVRENPKDGLKYVWIPPGTFMMGCSPGDNVCFPEEKPAHQVTITKGFWLGETPVTVGAYKRFAAATGRQMPPEPDLYGRPLNAGWRNESMPIVDVTWDDAQAYCGWAGGRLPTEAEWEYAARSGSTAARYGDLDQIAWYLDNSGSQPLDDTKIFKEDQANYAKRLNENGNGMHEVGQKRANAFGLYDILGNVWEWVGDWYDEKYYQSSPSQDPSGPASGQFRVLRGGSWSYDPLYVRVSVRGRYYPGGGVDYYGFRCGGEVFVP